MDNEYVKFQEKIKKKVREQLKLDFSKVGQEFNGLELTAHQAEVLIDIWNYRIGRYYVFTVNDLKELLHIEDRRHVDTNLGWTKPIRMDEDFSVEVGSNSIIVKLNLKPYKELV